MSWVRIWIHLVFSTKNREPSLTDAIRDKIFNHIKDNCESKGIYLKCINGWKDHCHCLISINKDMSISRAAQLIKGESSAWINRQKLSKNFKWQDDYFAVSVSESKINNVVKYIENQEEHHRFKSFTKEYDEFIEYFKK
ncbi:MAG: IS200/IS605 family transposase [Chlorobiota bacterium]